MDHLRQHLATLQGSQPSAGAQESREPTTLDGVVAVAAAMTKLCASSEQLASTLAGRLTASPVTEVAKQYQAALKEIGLEGTREASQLVANVSTLYEEEDTENDSQKSVETSIEALLLVLQSQYHFCHFASEQLSRFAHAQSPTEQTSSDQLTERDVSSTASTPPPIPTRPNKLKQRSAASSPGMNTSSVSVSSVGSPRGLRKHISMLFSRLGSKSSHPAEPRSSFFVQLGDTTTESSEKDGATVRKLSDENVTASAAAAAPLVEKTASSTGMAASEAELDTVINLLSGASRAPPLYRPPPGAPPGAQPPPPPSFPPPPLPQHLASRAVGSQRRCAVQQVVPPPPGGSGVNHSYRGMRSQLHQHHQQHHQHHADAVTSAAKTNTWPSKVHRIDGASMPAALPSSDAGILLATGNNPWSVLEAEMPSSWPCYANDGQDYGSQQWSTAADSSSGSDASSSTTDQPWTYNMHRQRENQSEDFTTSADDIQAMVTAGQPLWNAKHAWNAAPAASGWGEMDTMNSHLPVSTPSTTVPPWGDVGLPHPY